MRRVIQTAERCTNAFPWPSGVPGRSRVLVAANVRHRVGHVVSCRMSPRFRVDVDGFAMMEILVREVAAFFRPIVIPTAEGDASLEALVAQVEAYAARADHDPRGTWPLVVVLAEHGIRPARLRISPPHLATRPS